MTEEKHCDKQTPDIEQETSDALIKKELFASLWGASLWGNRPPVDNVNNTAIQFIATPPIIFSGTGELEITPELEAFFVRDDGIRSGEVTLRGTRLTPQEVIDIVDWGEREDYDYMSDEQIEACRRIVAEAPSWSTAPIFNLDNCPEVNFHVTRKDWNHVDYDKTSGVIEEVEEEKKKKKNITDTNTNNDIV